MAEENITDLVATFIKVYSGIETDNVSVIADIYHDDVIFEDPAHKIEGIKNLLSYFERLFKSVGSCKFDIHESICSHDVAYLQWTMIFSHPKLFKGNEQQVFGCSRIEFSQGKVIHHRDYFDMGQMIYEGVPLLGVLIRKLKSQV